MKIKVDFFLFFFFFFIETNWLQSRPTMFKIICPLKENSTTAAEGCIDLQHNVEKNIFFVVVVFFCYVLFFLFGFFFLDMEQHRLYFWWCCSSTEWFVSYTEMQAILCCSSKTRPLLRRHQLSVHYFVLSQSWIYVVNGTFFVCLYDQSGGCAIAARKYWS